jgi:UDP-glucose 4-epimerase
MIALTGNKYLVTGSNGFIGSHLCDEIERQGKEVVRVDLKLGRDIIHSNEKWFKDVDVVFHQACSKCTVCRDNPYRDLRANAWGTFRVVETAIKMGVKKVVHASTGSINDGEPKSFYGVSKMAGEAYLGAFSEYHPSFRWTSLRYHHVFGPRQDSSDKGGVIPIFIRQALAGGPITVDGDGKQVRLFTHVKDVVAANLLCAEDPRTDGKVFNVMSDVTESILSLAHTVKDLCGGDIPIVHRDPKPGDIRKFVRNNEGLKELGLVYDNDFYRLLTETLFWYQDHHGTARSQTD